MEGCLPTYGTIGQLTSKSRCFLVYKFNPLPKQFDRVDTGGAAGPLDTLSAEGGIATGASAGNFDFSGVATTGAIQFATPSNGHMTATVLYDNSTITVNGSGQLQALGTSGTATTVGATTATILTIPMSDNSAMSLDILISAYESTGPAAAGSNLIATMIRSGGGVPTIVDDADDAQNLSGTLSASAYQLSGSGSDILVTVTGQAGLTINWKAVARTVSAP